MEPTASRAGGIDVPDHLLVVLGEFLLLMSVYRLDDGIQVERSAQARLTGALDTWRPGDPTGPVTSAVRSLTATGSQGATGVAELAQSWSNAGDV